MLVARVPRTQAEALRRALGGLLDGSRGSWRHGPWVDFPLRGPPPAAGLPGAMVTEAEGEHRPRYPRRPIEAVLASLDLPPGLLALVPRRWERLGDVVILRLPPPLRPHGAAVGAAFARALGARTVVERVGPIEGVERTPRVALLHGTTTETLHRENGIGYRLDVARTMFSAGNLGERLRMARVGRPGEVVVDLFAGIGYFTLPLAVHGRARRVYACEIHPLASRYLRENAALNGVADRVEVHEGDCREVAPRGVADRVVMGYLWGGPAFLPTGLRALRGAGVLHYHALATTGDPGRPWGDVAAAATGEGLTVRLLGRRRVKSYAPGLDHVVLDVAVGG